jgi:hypothetical protein
MVLAGEDVALLVGEDSHTQVEPDLFTFTQHTQPLLQPIFLCLQDNISLLSVVTTTVTHSMVTQFLHQLTPTLGFLRLLRNALVITRPLAYKTSALITLSTAFNLKYIFFIHVIRLFKFMLTY